MSFPWREQLPAITCPYLLVTGDPAAGAIVTPQVAQEAASLWRQGEVDPDPGSRALHPSRSLYRDYASDPGISESGLSYYWRLSRLHEEINNLFKINIPSYKHACWETNQDRVFK